MEKQMIHEKIIAILADSDAIAKDRKNQQQGFNFRGIDDVYNALHPILAKHGVFSTTEVIAERTEERQTKSGGNLIYRILTVKFTFYAADGSHVESVMIGEGMDSGDKASNKAMAIAHKYALLQLLAIPTEDAKDPDAETHHVVARPTPQATKPATMPPTKLGPQAPIGKPPEDGMRDRCAAIVNQLGLDKTTSASILRAHGGTHGEAGWTGVDWAGVLSELTNRQRNAMDPDTEAQIGRIFDGVPA